MGDSFKFEIERTEDPIYGPQMEIVARIPCYGGNLVVKYYPSRGFGDDENYDVAYYGPRGGFHWGGLLTAPIFEALTGLSATFDSAAANKTFKDFLKEHRAWHDCPNCQDGCLAEKRCDGCETLLCSACFSEHSNVGAFHDSQAQHAPAAPERECGCEECSTIVMPKHGHEGIDQACTFPVTKECAVCDKWLCDPCGDEHEGYECRVEVLATWRLPADIERTPRRKR